MHLLLALPLLLGVPAAPASDQDHLRMLRADFMHVIPCPSTGDVGRLCPGHEIDHVVALCAGGAHSITNMRWLPRREAREKAQRDAEACRRERASR